jgi:Cu-Zn family superoxide dismutase
MKRVAAMAFALLSLGLGIAGCAEVSSDAAQTATGTPSPTPLVRGHGTFIPTTPPPSGVANAYAYDNALVPLTASGDVSLATTANQTQALLSVSGFVPNRSYGAHLNVNPCGIDPNAAGPHFENTPDPAASQTPSTNPTFANPTNEVWLDFTTDRTGSALSGTEVPWLATAQRHPRSLVIYADRTMTGPGQAGNAGRRIACLTIPS